MPQYPLILLYLPDVANPPRLILRLTHLINGIHNLYKPYIDYVYHRCKSTPENPVCLYLLSVQKDYLD